jgi:hypothetical protein
MSQAPYRPLRFACPCCGYPTLPELASYEICELCNWEDDGQGDEAADEMWGGANSDYSLTEARINFRKHRVMYAPGRDQRITGGDSALEYETKGQLMAVFDRLSSAQPSEQAALLAEIEGLEAVLRAETDRQVRAYEAEQRGNA